MVVPCTYSKLIMGGRIRQRGVGVGRHPPTPLQGGLEQLFSNAEGGFTADPPLIGKSRERQLDLPPVLHCDLRNGKVLDGKTGGIKDSDRVRARPLLLPDHDLAKRAG